MKLTTYRTDDGTKLGIKTERGILDVARAGQRPAWPVRRARTPFIR